MSSSDSNTKSEGIIDKIYGSLQKVASSTSSTLSSSVQSGYNSLFEGSSLYIGLIVVVIVCVLIAYLLYYLITTRVFLQSVIMAEETKSPVICTEKQKYKADGSISTIQNSNKQGWCYIGLDSGFRHCSHIGVNDVCMSGDIYPSQEVCINPNLRI